MAAADRTQPSSPVNTATPQPAQAGAAKDGNIGDSQVFDVTLGPPINLPKGGGAIRGMGEKFAVNAATGAGSLTIPIAVSPGRGLAPGLALTYDTSRGNGPFGLGWSMRTAAVTRKTDKGLPTYRDRPDSDGPADTFLVTDYDDLVAVLDLDGAPVQDEARESGYRVEAFRPRIEGAFTRTERWTRTSDGDTHWRTITADNVLHIYGPDPSSRIADPTDSSRVFSWLISSSQDDRGNVIIYDYVADNGCGIDVSRACEHARGAINDPRRTANRYLKRIRYCNDRPLLDPEGHRPRFLDPAALEMVRWLHEVVLDYGEHDAKAPTPDDTGEWIMRADPFSSYRSGFEVRTTRLCMRLLMFHHFPATPRETSYDGLVRSINLGYDCDPEAAPSYALLKTVTQKGYRRTGDGYITRALPPLELTYTQPVIGCNVVQVTDTDTLENLPAGVGAGTWTDLYGDGLPGVLTEVGPAWFYKPNISPLDRAGARLGHQEVVAAKPNVTLAGGHARLHDIDGNGRPDVLILTEAMQGRYEQNLDGQWGPLQVFPTALNLNFADSRLRLMDIDGDGRNDLLLADADVGRWHPNLGSTGFGRAQRVWRPPAERSETGALLDDTLSAFAADMSGDGMADLVQVRNGEVCYWPNLGYGSFGDRITMDDSPVFDEPDQFDPRRLRLADIDGSGTTDLIYLHRKGIQLYFNQSGNGWSARRTLDVIPPADQLADISAIDLLGNGTTCLTFSSPSAAETGRPLRYVELMAAGKPHLLERATNNLGAETILRYAPSTHFQLADRAAGRPWRTKLPFPVHVVEQVDTVDWVSRSRFTSRYAYHDGCFDEVEREFAGFAMVEQWDTDERTDDTGVGISWPATPWRPPKLTRTWFHTGTERPDPSARADRYWYPPRLAGERHRARRYATLSHDATVDAPTEEYRQALRALRGRVIRSEVYGLDNSPAQNHPYTVSQQSFHVRRVQPTGPNLHAVFHAVPLESLTASYERDPDDARMVHEFTLESDFFGNPLRALTLAYPRSAAANGHRLDADSAKALANIQATPIVTAHLQVMTESLTDAARHPDDHRLPRTARAATAAVTWPNPGAGALATWTDAQRAWHLAAANPIAYEDIPETLVDASGPPTIPSWRPIADQLIRYRRDDLTGLLPPLRLDPRALPGQAYRKAITDGQANRVLTGLATDTNLHDAGYVRIDGEEGWWLPSGQLRYSPGRDDSPDTELEAAIAHFFVPRRLIDSFGAVSSTDYDSFDTARVKSVDAVGNSTGCTLDYRVLQPSEVIDANGCVSQAAFDAFGEVTGIALVGTSDEPTGDSLDEFVADLDPDVERELVDDLTGASTALAAATSRTVLDRNGFWRTRDSAEPAATCTVTIHRENRHGTAQVMLQVTVDHNDGLGRGVQRKSQAEPGPVGVGAAPTEDRWVGSSWVVHDRLGDELQTFEPFFSRTHRYEGDRRHGVATTTLRDPLRRVVGRLHPDASWEKTVLEPWRHETWDRNDTAAVADCRTDPHIGDALRRIIGDAPHAYSSWVQQRLAGDIGSTPEDVVAERDAATKALTLANTPAVSHLDPLGRLSMAVTDAGPDGLLVNRVATDLSDRPLAALDPAGRRAFENLVREATDSGTRYIAGIDMAGRILCRVGIDTGEHRTLPDVEGRPTRISGPRVAVRWRYDAARRPTHIYAHHQGAAEILAERRIYGEGLKGRNAAGRMFRTYDSAGMIENTHYDVMGSITATARHLTADHHAQPDWSALADLSAPDELDAATAELLTDGTALISSTIYDALGRPVQTVTPHDDTVAANIVRHRYGRGGLLDGIDVWVGLAAPVEQVIDPATADLHPVLNIDYDAHGRCIRRERSNGAITEYTYDPVSTRLQVARTVRRGQPVDKRVVQDLHYTSDPTGNITRIRDAADIHNVVFFRGQRVDPTMDFRYDHMDRLIRATGREHLGQTGSGALAGPTMPGPSDLPPQLHPGDGNAMGRYTETYRYDALGNVLEVTHDVISGRWRRGYSYAEPSAIEPARTGNRLSATGPAGMAAGAWTDRYTYDSDGNTVTMPHLSTMQWDLGGRLASTATQVVAAPALPETTYYTYDGTGERLRMVTDRANGSAPRTERISVAGIDVDREYASDGTLTAQRDTLHVVVGSETLALIEMSRTDQETGRQRLIRHQFDNHLGSATLDLDDAAAVMGYEEYFPYGGTSYRAVRSLTETPKRLRFLGRDRDEPTGLTNIGARYYAPWLGRWLSPDPAETGEGLNLYLYARANPITLRDINGREIEGYVVGPGRPGNQPWMWFLGVSAHRIIAYAYVGKHMQEQADIRTNYHRIADILKDLGIGDPSRLTDREQNLKPDITNNASREVFEIKPWNQDGLDAGRKQVKDYRDALNKGMGVPEKGTGKGDAKYPFLLGIGENGQMGVQFHGGKMVWRITWKTTEDGVIQYKWQKTNKTDRDQIREAGEGQWVDITEADAQAYGEEAAQTMLDSIGQKEKLFKAMDITNMLQDVVGTIAMSFLSAAILSMRPSVQPGVAAPAPGAVPRAPAPPPLPPPRAPTPPPNAPPPWMIQRPQGAPPPSIGAH